MPNYRVGGADAFALEIASEILSDGKSSRLYKDLVIDKRMVVEVSAELRHDVVRPRTVRAFRRRCAPG